MSCYGWEAGTLKIPTKAWKQLRDGLAAAHNVRQEKLYKAALGLHAKAIEFKKNAKRGTFTVEEAWRSIAALLDKGDQCEIGSDEYYAIKCSIFGPDNEQKGTILLPKKKDFPPAVSTKHKQYSADEGAITLNHETNELNWCVPENNHAVERARDSHMGKALFTLLGKVVWTRGTGGEIVGNDEYNEESRESGGGANYVTATYRMKSKAELAAEEKQRLMMNRSRYGGALYGYR